MAEVLTEAFLYNLGLKENVVRDLMDKRNLLLQQFARSRKRTAYMIARDLEDAATSENELEDELVAAFNSLGFEARRISGKSNPDGIAIAYLAGNQPDGKPKKYSVSLEAKSKESKEGRVSSNDANIMRILTHRDKNDCDYTIIVGPNFSTTQGEDSALVEDIRTAEQKIGKKITLMRIVDLARLVRLRPLKHLGLDEIRELFETCVFPEESAKWVDYIENTKRENPPYKEIVETIWELQKDKPNWPVDFPVLETVLRREKKINIDRVKLEDLCKSLQEMTREIVVLANTVEMNQNPESILRSIRRNLKEFPNDEQKIANFDW